MTHHNQEEIQKLDSQIEEHKAVKLMVTELDKRQVEYDHYVDKLRNMSSAPGDRLAANEHKRKVAQEHLDSCTSSLVRLLLRAQSVSLPLPLPLPSFLSPWSTVTQSVVVASTTSPWQAACGGRGTDAGRRRAVNNRRRRRRWRRR